MESLIKLATANRLRESWTNTSKDSFNKGHSIFFFSNHRLTFFSYNNIVFFLLWYSISRPQRGQLISSYHVDAGGLLPAGRWSCACALEVPYLFILLDKPFFSLSIRFLYLKIVIHNANFFYCNCGVATVATETVKVIFKFLHGDVLVWFCRHVEAYFNRQIMNNYILKKVMDTFKARTDLKVGIKNAQCDATWRNLMRSKM